MGGCHVLASVAVVLQIHRSDNPDLLVGSLCDVVEVPLRVPFASEIVGAVAGLDLNDIQTVGFTHAYWEEKRDHLSHPIPVVSRIRNKVAKVFAGLDSDETILDGDSECDA